MNHGIRGEAAKRDQEYVRDLAEKLHVPLEEYEADIPALAKEWKMTEEEAGRRYRYECFEGVKEKRRGNRIAVAHHKNDQAETVLFQLFRGSGLRGLGGMHPKREDLIRPLLDITKEEILETLEKYGIKYCEDLTNGENEYARNRIRNELFPWVEEKLQKKAQSHIAASASCLWDVLSYLEEQTDRVYAEMVTQTERKCRIQKKDFASCHPVLQRELVLKMIEELAGRKKDITGAHIEQVRKVFLGETGKQGMLPYGLTAKGEYEVLYLEKKGKQEETEEFALFSETELLPGQSYEIPYTNGKNRVFEVRKRKISGISEINPKKYCTKCFDYDKISSVALFRYPLAGDYLLLDKAGRKKKLGRIFIDEKISAWRRKHMVVLAEGNHVLWVPELERCSAFYYLSEESREMLYIYEKR